ncbi:hypothetical protein BASA50_002298 [Batrachochytrium salamandrivorans]|uniref:Uncharacterized protein n=1 Tax=Batrachochytrium salamandrivorans TaxID=1357716 RepID=A0ABQ8FPH8_9FUNG|nr:hypothetical protein BASA50_002298 [Batrachochytrium salamandrivorans]
MSHAPTPSKGSPKPLSEAPVSCPFTPSPSPKKGTPIRVHSNLWSSKRSPITKAPSAKRPRSSPISRPTTMSMLDEMSRVLEKTSQEHRDFEKTMLNKLDTLTDNVSQQILSIVSSFQTALSSIEAKVDSLVQGVDNVRTEVEGTRVDIDTVVEGANSEMCSVKEYLKAVASSSAIIMSKLEVLGLSPHVPQFLNQPSYAMMASHLPANTLTTGSRTTTTDTHTAAISSTPTPTHISHIGSDDIFTVLLGGSLLGTNTAGNTEAYPGQQWLTGTVEEGNLLDSNQPVAHRMCDFL